MNIDNAVLIFTDGKTGHAYARQLNQWETNLVLAQLQALDDGAVKATRIEPVLIRSAGMTEERAQEVAEVQRRAAKELEILPRAISGRTPGRIVEKQATLHEAARTGVDAFIGMAGVTVAKGTGRITGGVQQIPKPQPWATHLPLDETIACYRCREQVLKREVLAADGFCPVCDAEIETDDDDDTPPQHVGEPDDTAMCYQCGQQTRQRLVGETWHCKACHAIQCERVRCSACGKTCTRPDGAHYCNGGVGDGQE